MAVSASYRAFVLERLGLVAPVKAKSMFGGVGLYAEGLFFALLDDDRLYFKVDATTRPDFEAKGMGPFDPFKDGRVMNGYWELPGEVLEEDDLLASWMRRALGVAAKAGAKKKKVSRAR
jgi:DNA transformation protein